MKALTPGMGTTRGPSPSLSFEAPTGNGRNSPLKALPVPLPSTFSPGGDPSSQHLLGALDPEREPEIKGEGLPREVDEGPEVTATSRDGGEAFSRGQRCLSASEMRPEVTA